MRYTPAKIPLRWGISGGNGAVAVCIFLSKTVRLCQCVVLREKGCGGMAYERKGWLKAVKLSKEVTESLENKE